MVLALPAAEVHQRHWVCVCVATAHSPRWSWSVRRSTYLSLWESRNRSVTAEHFLCGSPLQGWRLCPRYLLLLLRVYASPEERRHDQLPGHLLDGRKHRSCRWEQKCTHTRLCFIQRLTPLLQVPWKLLSFLPWKLTDVATRWIPDFLSLRVPCGIKAVIPCIHILGIAWSLIQTMSLSAGLAWLVIPKTWTHFSLGFVDFKSWRLFVVLCSIPSLSSALIIKLFMPESPKFLMEVRRILTCEAPLFFLSLSWDFCHLCPPPGRPWERSAPCLSPDV